MRLAVAIIALAAQGCATIQFPLKQDRVDAVFLVPREGARSSEVHMDVHADLAVRGGACSLVQVRARHDARRSTASVDHVRDEDGRSLVNVTLTTEEAVLFHTSVDGCVSTELPLTLQTRQSAGDATVDLSGVQLRGLQMVTGTGDLNVDFGDAAVAGARLRFETGTGDVEVDAQRTSWTGTNTLHIQAGTGDVTLYLPRGIGIELDVRSDVGDLDVRGLEADPAEEGYRNALAATAPARLEVEIESGTGDVTVIAG